jgi:hypothetical protein
VIGAAGASSRGEKGDGESEQPGDDHERGHGRGRNPRLVPETGRLIHVDRDGLRVSLNPTSIGPEEEALRPDAIVSATDIDRAGRPRRTVR